MDEWKSLFIESELEEDKDFETARLKWEAEKEILYLRTYVDLTQKQARNY